MASTQNSDLGYQVGKYRVVARLGAGGMGAVYKALDQESGRLVALKILTPEAALKQNALNRFRREAELGQRLKHDNIVLLYEFGEHAGSCYLAMELVEGIDLGRYLEKHGRLGPGPARLILTQMALALDHAFQCGVIHRDIKPGNILLTSANNRFLAKLADFGLARLEGDDQFQITRDGHTVGTVDYLPPEQARNSRAADIRSDLYSLGCTLYHMLTGHPPFNEGTLTERILRHAEEDPPDPRQENPDIPASLAAVCLRLMAKRPEERFQTPAELLEAARGGGRDTRPEPAAAETLNLRRRTTVVQDAEEAEEKSNPDTSTDTPRTEAQLPNVPPAEPAPQPLAQRRASPGPGPGPTRPGNPEKRVAFALFERANEVLRTADYDYGIQLLRECCRRELTNVLFRQSLRQALREQARQRPPSPWHAPLGDLVLRARYWLARLLKRHPAVLDLGELLLLAAPRNVDIGLHMAEAAECLEGLDLADWLLEEMRKEAGKDLRILRARALLQEKRGDAGLALQAWEQVLHLDPFNAEAQRRIQHLSASAAVAKRLN